MDVMNDSLFPLLAIVVFFVALLFIKAITKKKFCVLCVAVSVTWIGLLALKAFGAFNQPLVLGVLMGESIFGVYHLVEKRTPDAWHVFRLPFLLTLTGFAFVLLQISFSLWALTFFLGVLWLGGLVFFFGRNNARISRVAKSLLACCKDW